MTDTTQNEITGIHKVPLYGALSVAVLTVVLVTASVLTGEGQVNRAVGQPTKERSISFQSEAGGMFSVIDAQTLEKIQSFGKGEAAFMRTSIRSLTLNRSANDVRPELPYRLIEATNGTLSLIDPETGHSIMLSAFGAVATDSFSLLLPGAPKTQPPEALQEQAQTANQSVPQLKTGA